MYKTPMGISALNGVEGGRGKLLESIELIIKIRLTDFKMTVCYFLWFDDVTHLPLPLIKQHNLFAAFLLYCLMACSFGCPASSGSMMQVLCCFVSFVMWLLFATSSHLTMQLVWPTCSHWFLLLKATCLACFLSSDNVTPLAHFLSFNDMTPVPLHQLLLLVLVM